MRKYIVFETEDDSKMVEVNITFIVEVETEITKFNKTGKMGDNERAISLIEKCPFDIKKLKHISVLFKS
jgi:hypothetical protein